MQAKCEYHLMANSIPAFNVTKRTWFLYDFRATVESLRVTGGLPPSSRPLLTSPPSVRDGDSELDLAELMGVRHEMF